MWDTYSSGVILGEYGYDNFIKAVTKGGRDDFGVYQTTFDTPETICASIDIGFNGLNYNSHHRLSWFLSWFLDYLV